MLNMKLYLKFENETKEIYPTYLTVEEKRELRTEIGEKKEVMWCGCRQDKKLFYRISQDLRFYPEHQGYEHDVNCLRYDKDAARKRSGYVQDESGITTVFMKFNPKNFSVPAAKEEEKEADIQITVTAEGNSEEAELSKEKEPEKEDAVQKDPFLSLGALVRNINIDTYNERIALGKSALSADYFLSAISGKLNRVRVHGMDKTLRQLSLEDDGFRFFYFPYKGSFGKERDGRISYNIQLGGKEGKVYSQFIYEHTLKKAEKEYIKTYGSEPDGENVMAAGFLYQRWNRFKTSTYKVVGRLHLFQVSQNGIYCKDTQEIEMYDTLLSFVRNRGHGRFRLFLSSEDGPEIGEMEIEGRIGKGIITAQTDTEDSTQNNTPTLYRKKGVNWTEKELDDFIAKIFQQK